MKIAAKSSAESAAHRRASAPAMPMAVGNAYETNLHAIQAEHTRQAYLDDYLLLQQLHRARAEGVLDVTFRTRTSEVTVPITYKSGNQMIMEATELLMVKMDGLENEIVSYTEYSEKEDQGDAEGITERAKLLAFCAPMRRLTDAEFAALPTEFQRAYEGYGDCPRFTDAAYEAQNSRAAEKGGKAA